MTYITNADIEERVGTRTLIQLTDDEGTGSVDTDKVDEARLGAEGEVNSYLARRFAVPIDVSVHEELAGLLASIALDIAAFRLHCRRPPVADEIADKRDAAIQWLREVASGEARLPSESEVPGNTANGLSASTMGRERVMTDDELRSL